MTKKKKSEQAFHKVNITGIRYIYEVWFVSEYTVNLKDAS